MKVCFPVLQSEGLQSEVYGHFGSAPAFVVIDFDSNELKTITNKDAHHAHGQCNPLKALDNHKVDAIVVGGIGAGALMKLNQQGVKVFSCRSFISRTKYPSIEKWFFIPVYISKYMLRTQSFRQLRAYSSKVLI